MRETKNIIILILSVAIIVICYIGFKYNQLAYDKKFSDEQVKVLQEENEMKTKHFLEERYKTVKLLHTIDSIQNEKPKIINTYEKKAKRVDNAHVNAVVDEFKVIFTNNNIK